MNKAIDDSSLHNGCSDKVEKVEDANGGHGDGQDPTGSDSAEEFSSNASSSVGEKMNNFNDSFAMDSRVIDREWCGICLDSLTNPKKLPCDHIFCMECMEEYLKKSGSPWTRPRCENTPSVFEDENPKVCII